MRYLIGSGWWILWHAVLWLAVTPFVVMTALLTRASPNDPTPALEVAFAVSTVGLFVLLVATAISGYLWTAGGGASGLWPYVRNIVGAALIAVVVGLALIFGAGYYAATPKQPMANRWMAQLTCLVSALALLFFSLHATWRFRHR